MAPTHWQSSTAALLSVFSLQKYAEAAAKCGGVEIGDFAALCATDSADVIEKLRPTPQDRLKLLQVVAFLASANRPTGIEVAAPGAASPQPKARSTSAPNVEALRAENDELREELREALQDLESSKRCELRLREILQQKSAELQMMMGQLQGMAFSSEFGDIFGSLDCDVGFLSGDGYPDKMKSLEDNSELSLPEPPSPDKSRGAPEDEDDDWTDRVDDPVLRQINDPSAATPTAIGRLMRGAPVKGEKVDPLRPLCAALQSEIVSSMSHSRPHDAGEGECAQAAIFLPPEILHRLERRQSPNEFVITDVPELWEIHTPLEKAMKKGGLPEEAAVLCLLYMERWIHGSGIRLIPDNWLVLAVVGLALATKVWDGGSQNLGPLLPSIPQPQLVEASKLFARVMGSHVEVRGADYQGAYFALRMLAGQQLSVKPLGPKDADALARRSREARAHLRTDLAGTM